MSRILLAGLVINLAMATLGSAKEPPRHDELVHWTLDRDVKTLIDEEIAKFEQHLKEKLGEKRLKSNPYVVVGEHKDDPRAASLEAITLEQVLDGCFRIMRTWADHDSQDFLPGFVADRRAPIASGSDIVNTPIMAPKYPKMGNLKGNVTFEVEWEQTAGGFLNEWDQNDIDEVYEAELQATLTLGVEVLIYNDEARTMTLVSHSVTKPLVRDWRVKLLASEGEVQKSSVIKKKPTTKR